MSNQQSAISDPQLERRPCRAFTLLEVLLSLMLTSLVLIALGMAIDFHLRVVDKSRTDVEEAQLARAILHLIADDLRRAVSYRPVEGQGLAPATGAASGSTGELADQPDVDTSESEPLDSEPTTDPAQSVVSTSVPGVYGEINWLQVDVNRLPRLDQYQYMTSPETGYPVVDCLSDVKTVAYFVVSSESVYTTDGSQCQNGLVRRESDRAVTTWADKQGRLAQMELKLEAVAPEVAAIEFHYFDGTEWLDYWDSEERGGLPLAVEIALAFLPTWQQAAGSGQWAVVGGDSVGGQPDSSFTVGYGEFPEEGESTVYRLVVHLPAAEASSEGTSASAAESTETTELGLTGSDAGREEPGR